MTGIEEADFTNCHWFKETSSSNIMSITVFISMITFSEKQNGVIFNIYITGSGLGMVGGVSNFL